MIDYCPACFVTPESNELIQIFGQARATGVPLFGTSLATWSTKAADAAAVIECEEQRYKNALQEAIRETHRR